MTVSVVAFLGAEQGGFLLRPPDEHHPLAGGEVVELFVHHVVFALPFGEVDPGHPVDLELDVVAGGLSTPQDVDEMWKLTFGTEIGHFRAVDYVGLDVVYDIEKHYAAENLNLPAHPRNLLRHCIDAGELGLKAGEGFYADYPNTEAQN